MRRRLRDGRDGRALVEELERVGEALPAGPDKSQWFLELAVACEMLVPERQRALQLYSRAVDLDPGNGEALDRGRMVSRELGRIDELIRLTEIELGREQDESRREHLSALIGEALLDLGDRQRAAAFLVGAAGQFPASLAIQDALGTIGYDDDWRKEVARLIAISDDAEDAAAGARVSLRAARILRMEAPEDERYEELLQRVLYYDPYHESAHLLLDGFYAAAGRWEELEALQDALVRAFPGRDEQAALCQRFSFSWIARGQHDRAAAWCWRAIELGQLVFPIAGLTMLRGIYGSRRDWDRLLEAIDALLATEMEEDADVHAALLGGTIAWKAKADLPRAKQYFDRVRRVAVDSLLVIDFDDALADRRNPEVIGAEQQALIDAARAASKSAPTDRAIEAWRKAIAVDPHKRAPRRALARVLYRAERWRTLADALKDEEAHACRDDGERVALLMQLAALYRDRLRHDVLWTATLQRILELQPDNLAALDQLEAAFESMRRWPDVVATLQRKLPHVADARERVDLQLKLAEIWQQQLGNEAESVKALENALALEPARADLAERLERIYAKRREWDKLFALKQARAAALADPAARLPAALELATLATEKLRKPALAIGAWEAVLALDGAHEGALAALERLYLVEKAHAPLADLYARRAERGDPATRLGYLQKLGQLCLGELDDAPRAIAAWQKVLALSPGHGRALETLKRLYVAARDWDALEALFAEEKRLDECARLFERQAADEAPAVQVALWLRAGRLWREALGRRDGAQRAFERVLAIEPRHPEAVEALVALYDEAGDPKKLAGVLALQLEHPTDAATKKARLLRLGALHAHKLHDAAGAFRWQLAAFEADPGDAAVRAELERLAARTGGWAELVARYEAAAAAQPEADRVAILSTVAREKEAALGDVDGALATWQVLAALEPPPDEALEALGRIYEARQAWRELHDVYARKLTRAGDAAARRPIVVAMAALAERQGDDARAIAAYRRLADELGADDATLDALEKLYERTGALAEVEAVLLERLALPAPREAAHARATALRFRLAEARRRLGRLDEAIAGYGQVLEDEPNHAGARAALDAIADGPSHRLQAALLLEPLLRATGATARLCDILRIRIAHAGAPEEALALMHELAWLEEHELGRRDAAFATLAEALRAAPAHQPTYDALERLSEAAGDWERLAALYREVAARPLGVGEHLEVRCRLGALYRDRLGLPDRARATFARVLDICPEHTPAVLAVAELAHRAGDGAGALAAWASLLARDPGSAAALAGLERLFADGLERLRVAALLMPRYREAGRAADLVRLSAAALIEAPDAQPLDELLALAREAGETAAVRAALGRAIARAAASETRAALGIALAELEREGGELGAAEAALRRVLDENAAQPEALRLYDAVLAQAGRHADRAAVLERRAALADGDARRELLLVRAGVQAEALGDAAAARATLEAALELGDEPRVLRALARLADDEAAMALWERLRARLPDDAEALAELAALYERHERWSLLVDVLERQLGSAPAEAAPALVEQQALVWARLGDRERGLDAWRRLAALTPEAPDPLRAIARLLRALERWSELADVLERLLALPLPADETAAAARQLARLETETLERPERAIAAWERLLAVEPLAEDAPPALEALYARTGRARDRRAMLERRAEAALRAHAADAATLLAEAARAAADAGEAEAAAAWWTRVVGVEPLHPGAQAALEAHHRGRGDLDALVALLRARAGRLFGEERGAVLAQVASIEEHERGRRGAAFAALLEAFDHDGRWSAYGADLERLAAAEDGWPLLSAVLERRAAAATGSERRELYLQLGDVLESAQKVPHAIEAWRAALAVDAGFVPALERLERTYRRTGQAALLDVLERHAELTLDPDQQLQLYDELAEAAMRLERWARAVAAYRRAAALEAPGAARAERLYRAGLLERDHLAAFDDALASFEAAADSYAAEGVEPPAALAEALARLRARARVDVSSAERR